MVDVFVCCLGRKDLTGRTRFIASFIINEMTPSNKRRILNKLYIRSQHTMHSQLHRPMKNQRTHPLRLHTPNPHAKRKEHTSPVSSSESMSVSYGARHSCLGNDRQPSPMRNGVSDATVPVWRARQQTTLSPPWRETLSTPLLRRYIQWRFVSLQLSQRPSLKYVQPHIYRQPASVADGRKPARRERQLTDSLPLSLTAVNAARALTNAKHRAPTRSIDFRV